MPYSKGFVLFFSVLLCSGFFDQGFLKVLVSTCVCGGWEGVCTWCFGVQRTVVLASLVCDGKTVLFRAQIGEVVWVGHSRTCVGVYTCSMLVVFLRILS